MIPGWYIIGAWSNEAHKEIVSKALDKDVTALKSFILNIDQSNELRFPSPTNNVVYVYHNGTRFTQYLFATGAMVRDGVEGTTLAVFDIPEKEESVE